jgi:predicted nucleotidyltransferase
MISECYCYRAGLLLFNDNKYIVALGEAPWDDKSVSELAVLSQGALNRIKADGQRRIIIQKDLPNDYAKENLLKEFAKKYLNEDLKLPEKTAHTRSERIKDVRKFAESAKKFTYVEYASLIGSMANETDKELSDSDIILIRKQCPGSRNCQVEELINGMSTHIDVFCLNRTDYNIIKNTNQDVLKSETEL